MTRKEKSLFTAFTPTLLVEYLNCYADNKSTTYSEFKGFTSVNGNDYLLVLNFLNTCDISIEYIDLVRFKSFLLKKKLSK